MDTECSLEDLTEVMVDRDEWRERKRDLGKSERTARHDDAGVPFEHQFSSFDLPSRVI